MTHGMNSQTENLLNQKTRAMILTKKQLRRRIEQSAIPARLHSIAFAEITKHRRLMWETEFIKADVAYRDAAKDYKARMSRTDTITHNEEHAI